MAKKTTRKATHLWVINLTDSNVQIGYKDRHGEDVALMLPVTHIPLDLTLQGLRKDIIEAPHYKRANTLGLIKEISDEEASEILNDSDAKAELARINELAPNINITGGGNVQVFNDPLNDEGDTDEIMLFSIQEKTTHAQQNNRFRTLVNSGSMTVGAARKIRKWTKNLPNKADRNKKLYEMAGTFINENDD